jgi:hypothetical protein
MLFVSHTIINWYSEYSYYKEFAGTAPDYWDQTEKWVDCASIYNGYYFNYMKIKQEREAAKVRSPQHVIQ